MFYGQLFCGAKLLAELDGLGRAAEAQRETALTRDYNGGEIMQRQANPAIPRYEEMHTKNGQTEWEYLLPQVAQTSASHFLICHLTC